MIELDCPRCGKHYSVDDQMEGAHAWCEACKSLLIVPGAAQEAPAQDLTPEEQVEFLRNLLRKAEERFRRKEERFQKTFETAQALYNRYKDLRAKFEERGLQIAADETRVEEAKAHVKRMARGLTAAAEAQGRAEARLARALEDLDRTAAELQEERASRAALQGERDRARTEAQALRESAATLESVSARLRDAETENARLRERMAATAGAPETVRLRQEALEREIERLSRDLEAERGARAEAEKAARAAHAQALRMEERSARVQQDIERALPHVERAGRLDAEMEGMRARLEEACAASTALRQDLERMAQARGEAEARFERATADVDRLTRDTEQVRAAHEETLARLQEAEARAAQAEVFRSDRDELRDQLRRTESELEHLKTQVLLQSQESGGAEIRAAEALQEAERLREEVAKERNRVAEARRTAHECRLRAERAEAEWHALETSLKEVRDRLAAFERADTSMAEAQARVVELEGVVDRLTAELRSVAQAMGAVESRGERLSAEVERLTAELEAERRTREVKAPPTEEAARSADAAQARKPLDGAAKANGKADPLMVFERAAPEEGLTFVAEIVDDVDGDEDDMMQSLLRFIEPEQ